MRLIVSEFFKLFSKRVFTICLVISLFANAFFLIYMQQSQPLSKNMHTYQSEYTELLESCNDSENPEAFIQSKRKEIEIGFFLLSTSANNSEDIYATKTKENYQKNYPNEFATATSNDLSREELQAKNELLVDISSQLEYINGYDEFIGEMQSRADQQLKFSIFAKPNTFSYNNIKKTPLDFEHLSGVSLEVGNNNALTAATTFQLTDYIVLVLVVLICIFLFGAERDKGLYPLVRSAKHGRTATALSKLAVIVFVTLVITIVLYAEALITGGLYYGFGDFSRNIQSAELFMNCSLDLTIGEYCLLWILGKVILFACLALFLSFVFAFVKTTAKAYATLAIGLSVEFFCYMFIESNSFLCVFKFVNPIYLMSGNNIFGVYQNVNFFEQPVNIITVFIVLCSIFALIGIFATCTAFAFSSQLAGKSTLLAKISSFIAKHSKIRGNVNLFSGEAFKHYKTSFAALVLAALAVFAYTNLTDELKVVYANPTESAYNVYMETLEGEMTEEKYAFINAEKQYFEELSLQQAQIAADETLSEDEKTLQYNSINSTIESKGKAFEEVCMQLEHTEIKSTEIGEPVALVNEIITKRLTHDTFRDWGYFTLMLAVVVFCTSNIFACEYKKNMVNLIRSNRNGKSKLLLTKLSTVLLTTTVTYILIYLPYMINYIRTFGTNSFNIPLAYSRDFDMLTSSVSVFEYVLILGVVHFIVAIAATCLIYMLSMLLKNNSMTMIVSSGLLLVPCIFAIDMEQLRMMSTFKNNVWLSVFATILVVCLCVIAISLVVTFMKFNNVLWRKKNACS